MTIPFPPRQRALREQLSVLFKNHYMARMRLPLSGRARHRGATEILDAMAGCRDTLRAIQECALELGGLADIDESSLVVMLRVGQLKREVQVELDMAQLIVNQSSDGAF